MPSNHAGAGPLRPRTATRRRLTHVLALQLIGFGMICGREAEDPIGFSPAPAISARPLLAMFQPLAWHLEALR